MGERPPAIVDEGLLAVSWPEEFSIAVLLEEISLGAARLKSAVAMLSAAEKTDALPTPSATQGDSVSFAKLLLAMASVWDCAARGAATRRTLYVPVVRCVVGTMPELR